MRYNNNNNNNNNVELCVQLVMNTVHNTTMYSVYYNSTHE